MSLTNHDVDADEPFVSVKTLLLALVIVAVWLGAIFLAAYLGMPTTR